MCEIDLHNMVYNAYWRMLVETDTIRSWKPDGSINIYLHHTTWFHIIITEDT